MNMISPTEKVVGERKIDARRGSTNGAVSAQWFSRPDDQRFTSLDDLLASVQRRRENSFEKLVKVEDFRFHASRDDETSLTITAGDDAPFAPTHYSMQQLCSLVGAPGPYIRRQHAMRAAFNLQQDVLDRGEGRDFKFYAENEEHTLRAITGPDYGRIYDADLVQAVMKFAGSGTGDTRWKIPGQIDWAKGTYNPFVDVTKQSTTLYASDRDVFMFLADDLHPIEIGKLPNGDPDYVMRGFYTYNSEVGARSMGIATFLFRGPCQNRILWGVEQFDELRIVHSKYGNRRFEREAAPALARYADASTATVLAGITAAREALVAPDDEARVKFLNKDLDLSMKMALNIIETHEREEGRKPETVWDLVQGMTAVARTIPNTDNRLELEKVAGKLMNRAARNAV